MIQFRSVSYNYHANTIINTRLILYIAYADGYTGNELQKIYQFVLQLSCTGVGINYTFNSITILSMITLLFSPWCPNILFVSISSICYIINVRIFLYCTYLTDCSVVIRLKKTNVFKLNL